MATVEKRPKNAGGTQRDSYTETYRNIDLNAGHFLNDTGLFAAKGTQQST